jgi:5-methylthioadenosine/S-adenosylhomocysteine deaminase
MQQVDALISAPWIVPVEPPGVVLHDHTVVVDAGRIVAVAPREKAQSDYRAENAVRLSRHVLIPGMVNAHTHAAMNLFKGMADDMVLTDWLEQRIWPAESRWTSEVFTREGTRLACAEMIRGGVTCFNDMFLYPEEVARTARECGMRATVGLIVLDIPTVWAGDADEYIAKGTEVHDRFRDDPLISTAFAPHSPYVLSDGPLERVRTLADELGIPVHMHVHETAAEVQTSMREHGLRPLARLDRLGLLSDRLQAVHMTQLTDDEIARLAECGASVIHCPESNLKLASGLCPVDKLLKAGVKVALGTDGAASNNDLNMLGEMHTCSLLAKGVAGDATAVPAAAALELATLGGARALGLEESIGSLVPGKGADLAALDFGGPESQPVYDPISHLVYASDRHMVSDVWIAGRRVLSDGTLMTVDADALVANAEEWRGRIASSDAAN